MILLPNIIETQISLYTPTLKSTKFVGTTEAMDRYLFKYAYIASIVHNDRKIEMNTFFTVVGRWKHVIQNQLLSYIMVIFTRKILKHAGNINRTTVFLKFVK